MSKLFEKHPLPWNYIIRQNNCIDEFVIISSISQHPVAIVSSETEAKDLTNLVNSTLTTKQKRSYGDSNTNMFVLRNKKTGMYRTNRYSIDSGAIARAKIWRNKRQADWKTIHSPDYEVVQVRLEALNAHTG